MQRFGLAFGVAVALSAGGLASPSVLAAAPSGTVLIERSATDYRSSESERANRAASKLSLGMSSWLPGSLELPSNLAGTSAFKSSGLPGVYATLTLPVIARDLGLQLGAAWFALDREAMLNLGGANLVKTQTLHLFSARLGLEYAPSALSTKYFEPMIALSALPSVGAGTRSGFDTQSAYYGLLGELVLGARIPVYAGWALELSGVATAGSLDSGNSEGVGFNAGLRVSL